MTIRIRPAEPADQFVLVDLWQRAWTAAMPALDFAARREWLIDRLAALASSGAMLLVACEANHLLGFVTVDPVSGTIDQLAVAVEHQRRGIGGRLIDAAKQLAPAGLRLTVNQDNLGAVALYRSHGFVPSGAGVNARSGLPVVDMAWRPSPSAS